MAETGSGGAQVLLKRFRRVFWRPPRVHGEVVEDRTVSFLELFYDLVYVVVIAQAAHHLAEHLDANGLFDFAVIFALIWIAWLNGTLYYELHGHEDARTRFFVFVQMAVLVMLAVFTGDAGGETGLAFAITYVIYLSILLWLWFSVYRRDEPRFKAPSLRFMASIVLAGGTLLAMTLLEDEARMVGWGLLVFVWLIGMILNGSRSSSMEEGLTVTESMVERFGLFTIIVLGEVVVGVVDGLGHAELDAITIATAMLALTIGFGFWWIYFDFTGRRLPRGDNPSIIRWMMANLPVTLAVAAAGAAMVSLIEHAHDEHTPEVTAWLLGGSVAVGLVGLAIITGLLLDYERLRIVYRPTRLAMLVGAVVALVVASLAPAPWLLAAALVAILSMIWLIAVFTWLQSDEAVEMAKSRGEG